MSKYVIRIRLDKKISIKKLIKNFSICCILTVIMYIALKFSGLTFKIDNVVLRTVVFSGIGCVIYLILLYIFREENICELLKTIKNKLNMRSKKNEKI